ncbi:MAG: LLM class F420-dependent oxidoreductase [Gammaproteobacteria bacterium]|nr:LLM class F420-dependent oxidoreductase [Gammaproteobacteria bacterium]
MKFGLRYCNTGRYVDGAAAVELVQAAEEAGFESAWTVEHTVVPEGYESAYPYSEDGKMAGGAHDFPLPDPLVWMAYVGGQTSRMKLGTGILILPQHNPVITAKQVATLDRMTGGRVLLGIGVGWLREEFDVIGAQFDERAARTDEYVAAMRALWGQERPSFAGEFVRFDGAYCRPQPLDGQVPIIVGGHSKAAARRAGRLGDGFFPARGASPELIALARETAEAAGRDPAQLEVTVSCPEDLDELKALSNLGVDRVLVPVTPTFGMPAAARDPEAVLGWRGRIEDHADV